MKNYKYIYSKFKYLNEILHINYINYILCACPHSPSLAQNSCEIHTNNASVNIAHHLSSGVLQSCDSIIGPCWHPTQSNSGDCNLGTWEAPAKHSGKTRPGFSTTYRLLPYNSAERHTPFWQPSGLSRASPQSPALLT